MNRRRPKRSRNQPMKTRHQPGDVRRADHAARRFAAAVLQHPTGSKKKKAKVRSRKFATATSETSRQRRRCTLLHGAWITAGRSQAKRRVGELRTPSGDDSPAARATSATSI
jgi:hypothetical protein